ncbi:MAG: 50S ribosomal protein L35 [Patescibacteria group bacterium]
MVKTNKSITKRLKITKTGKILRAGVGFNHFRAKKNRNTQLHIKRLKEINKDQINQIKAYIKH